MASTRTAATKKDTGQGQGIRRRNAPIPDHDSLQAGWGNHLVKIRGVMPMILIILAGSIYLTSLLLIRTADAPVTAIEKQTIEQSKEHAIINNHITEHRLMNAGEHKSLLDTQERIADSLDQQVFYLSKPESERAQYKIEMPDSLRNKLIGKRWNGPQP